jgi:hypothetical protein
MRNVGGMQTFRYVYKILWEELSRGNILALIYLLCMAYFPILFLHPDLFLADLACKKLVGWVEPFAKPIAFPRAIVVRQIRRRT